MEQVPLGLTFGVLIVAIIVGIIVGRRAGRNATRENLPGVAGATCIGCMLLIVVCAILGIFGFIIAGTKLIDMGQLVGCAVTAYGLSMLLGWLGSL